MGCRTRGALGTGGDGDRGAEKIRGSGVQDGGGKGGQEGVGGGEENSLTDQSP